jgi:hypothetical protein
MTAVQELKLYFEQQLSIHLSNEIKYTTKEALSDAIQICENCINTKEKQQIIDAYIDGVTGDSGAVNAEQYYNETFKNK